MLVKLCCFDAYFLGFLTLERRNNDVAIIMHLHDLLAKRRNAYHAFESHLMYKKQ